MYIKSTLRVHLPNDNFKLTSSLPPSLPPRRMTQWRFKRGVEEQTKSFLDGFNEVVPLHWLQFFDEKELEVNLKLHVVFNAAACSS